jgi:SAM-dependent methyltransferase
MAQAKQGGLAGLSDEVAAFQRAMSGVADDPALGYLEAAAAIHRLLAAVRAAELGGAAAEALRAVLAPARALHAASPLVRRIQTWPRGYPGDFETIELLCEGAAGGGQAHPLERACLATPPAQQHRNKVAWQAQQLLAAALARPGARLLSVACGGSRDVASIAPSLRGRGVALVLNDADPDALALSSRRAAAARAAVTTVPGDVFRAVRKLARLPAFDVVVAGGLFDYLDDRSATWLLSRLRALVAPGGALCFTNLAPGSPYAGWLDHLAGWTMIYRDEAAVTRLLRAAGAGPEEAIEVSRDPTGHALLVRCVRPAAARADLGAVPTHAWVARPAAAAFAAEA